GHPPRRISDPKTPSWVPKPADGVSPKNRVCDWRRRCLMGRVPRERRQKRQRVIKLNEETSQALSAQVEAFRRKFGREPSGDDPIFFDPDSDVPRPYPLDRVNLEL